MMTHNTKGQAFVELAAMIPLMVIFLLVIVQIAAVFTQAVHDLAVADSKAWKALNDWDSSHTGEGFTRPCIEDMDEQLFSHSGGPIAIGAGAWKKEINVPQEVKIVTEPVCISD